MREITLADVDRNALVADLGDLRDLEPFIALQLSQVGAGEALDEVELPGAQIREAHRRIGNRQIHDAIEMDVALVPVVGEAFEHDPVLRDALDKTERARAHGLGAEFVTLGLRRLGRNDHASAIGELRQ